MAVTKGLPGLNTFMSPGCAFAKFGVQPLGPCSFSVQFISHNSGRAMRGVTKRELHGQAMARR